MALVINDRVKETSTSTGTGTFTLAGAQTGFDTFALGIGGSNTTYYAIVNVGASPSEWEVGLGTLDAGGTVLTRTTVITSSNSDSVVTFTSGTKDVFCTLPASKAVYLDSTGVLVNQNEVRFQDTSGGEYVGLKAASTVPSSYTLTLPTADGTNGQAILTNGSGALSFGAAGISTGKAIAMAIVFG
jgi:hypothetical protein